MKHSLLAKQSPCPICGKLLNAAMGQDVPKPKDISVCGYCAAPLIYESDLSLRALTGLQVANLDISMINQILNIQTQILLMKKRMGQNVPGPQ